MSSVLTNNSRKSIYIYACFFIVITLFFIYFYLIKQPTLRSHFQEQAFYLNYAAFKNSIYLANMKFISHSNKGQKIDVLAEKSLDFDDKRSTNHRSSYESLDYNSAGFPIGTDILDKTIETPISIDNCLQIWKFLMGPLQAQIKHKKSNFNYWATLKSDGQCVFHSPDNLKNKIVYDSLKGSVIFFTIKGE